jgi:hypothetical protein
MPQIHEISACWFDTCYSDYVTDWSGIVVGVQKRGQTREEMIQEIADECYSDEDFPLGDHAFALLKSAIASVIPESCARFLPVDGSGNDLDPDDENTEIPDEQPSVWVRVRVTSRPMRIALDNQGGDHHENGSVLVTCDDKDAAADDGYIDGSSWETPRDMCEAYTILTDRPSLVEDLEREGYDVDASCYAAPDDEDLARWASNLERDNAR